jgi:hypothetical protein
MNCVRRQRETASALFFKSTPLRVSRYKSTVIAVGGIENGPALQYAHKPAAWDDRQSQ